MFSIQHLLTLVHSYLERFALQLGRPGLAVREDALAAMQAYPWPGNVRELINVIERAVLLSPGPEIGIGDLPPSLAGTAAAGAAAQPVSTPELAPSQARRPFKEARRAALDAWEVAYLRGLLDRTGWRIGEAARQAGLDPRSLYAKMRQHGLRKEDFRPTERS